MPAFITEGPVTKAYVDAVAQGLHVLGAVKVATTAAITPDGASAEPTLINNSNGAISIDGEALAVNDRVLVKNQSLAKQNGVYTVSVQGDGSTKYQLTRATDFDSLTDIKIGDFVFVTHGTSNGGNGFVMIGTDTFDGTDSGGATLGTTDITFTQFSSSIGATDNIQLGSLGVGVTATGSSGEIQCSQITSPTSTNLIIKPSTSTSQVRISDSGGSTLIGNTSKTLTLNSSNTLFFGGNYIDLKLGNSTGLSVTTDIGTKTYNGTLRGLYTGQNILISAPSGQIDINGGTRVEGGLGVGVDPSSTTGDITFTNILSAPDGSNSEPSITNTGNVDTGIYFPGDDEVGITTGGAQIVNVSSTGIDITGAITATGNITAYSSDKRLKTNIVPIQDPLSKLSTISGYTYRWNIDKCNKVGFKPEDIPEVGVLAQEINEILPEVIKPAPFDRDKDGNSSSGDNYLTVQYEKIVPLLIECIKAQQTQIDELKVCLSKLK